MSGGVPGGAAIAYQVSETKSGKVSAIAGMWGARKSCAARYPDGLEPSFFDVWESISQVGKDHVDLASNDVQNCWSHPAIWHVDDVYPCGMLQGSAVRCGVPPLPVDA